MSIKLPENCEKMGTMPNTGEVLYMSPEKSYYIVDSFNRVELVDNKDLVEIESYFKQSTPNDDKYICEKVCSSGFFEVMEGEKLEHYECGGWKMEGCRFK